MHSIRAEAEALESFLIKIRRTIHENPELGFQEFETAKLICQNLDEMGIPYQNNIAKTGIVATLSGNFGEGKTLLIRADMDALPLNEETNLPFKSKNKNVFHACGHDSHVSCLLGAAKILKQNQDKFKGSIKFVFQPAEEGSQLIHESGSGGADPMIQEGALGDSKNPNIDAALALHVIAGPEPMYQVGKICIKDGPMTGSADIFDITIKGKGGHASAPHTAVDPVFIASQIYIAIQGYLSRTVDPVEPVVFTIGKIQGGFRQNIISETCEMDGTLRTLNQEVRDQLKQSLPNFIQNIAQAYGGEAKVEVKTGYPVGVNSKSFNDIIKKVTIGLYGTDAIIETEKPVLGAEDFYEFGFSNSKPISMFWLGGANPDTGKIHSNHSNYFDIDEKALPMGTAVLVATALEYLNE